MVRGRFRWPAAVLVAASALWAPQGAAAGEAVRLPRALVEAITEPEASPGVARCHWRALHRLPLVEELARVLQDDLLEGKPFVAALLPALGPLEPIEDRAAEVWFACGEMLPGDRNCPLYVRTTLDAEDVAARYRDAGWIEFEEDGMRLLHAPLGVGERRRAEALAREWGELVELAGDPETRSWAEGELGASAADRLARAERSASWRLVVGERGWVILVPPYRPPEPPDLVELEPDTLPEARRGALARLTGPLRGAVLRAVLPAPLPAQTEQEQEAEDPPEDPLLIELRRLEAELARLELGPSEAVERRLGDVVVEVTVSGRGLRVRAEGELPGGAGVALTGVPLRQLLHLLRMEAAGTAPALELALADVRVHEDGDTVEATLELEDATLLAAAEAARRLARRRAELRERYEELLQREGVDGGAAERVDGEPAPPPAGGDGAGPREDDRPVLPAVIWKVLAKGGGALRCDWRRARGLLPAAAARELAESMRAPPIPIFGPLLAVEPLLGPLVPHVEEVWAPSAGFIPGPGVTSPVFARTSLPPEEIARRLRRAGWDPAPDDPARLAGPVPEGERELVQAQVEASVEAWRRLMEELGREEPGPGGRTLPGGPDPEALLSDLLALRRWNAVVGSGGWVVFFPPWHSARPPRLEPPPPDLGGEAVELVTEPLQHEACRIIDVPRPEGRGVEDGSELDELESMIEQLEPPDPLDGLDRCVLRAWVQGVDGGVAVDLEAELPADPLERGRAAASLRFLLDSLALITARVSPPLARALLDAELHRSGRVVTTTVTLPDEVTCTLLRRAAELETRRRRLLLRILELRRALGMVGPTAIP